MEPLCVRQTVTQLINTAPLFVPSNIHSPRGHKSRATPHAPMSLAEPCVRAQGSQGHAFICVLRSTSFCAQTHSGNRGDLCTVWSSQSLTFHIQESNTFPSNTDIKANFVVGFFLPLNTHTHTLPSGSAPRTQHLLPMPEYILVIF